MFASVRPLKVSRAHFNRIFGALLEDSGAVGHAFAGQISSTYVMSIVEGKNTTLSWTERGLLLERMLINLLFTPFSSIPYAFW